jgi:polyhydroxyalkanoate synthase subunit PhaE
MSDDPWRRWRAFDTAARAFFEALNAGSTAGAVQQFGDFLRDQFAPASPLMPPIPGALGPTREHQERQQRLSQAWQRLEAAERRLQRMWQDVLREASTSFVTQLGANVAALPSPDDVRALYDRWIDCAEGAYARTAHSEAFCQAQAEFVNAGSAWRLEQQAGVEQWLKQLDLPTRSEINSLTRRLHELEQRMHAAGDAASTDRPRKPRRPAGPRRGSRKP